MWIRVIFSNYKLKYKILNKKWKLNDFHTNLLYNGISICTDPYPKLVATFFFTVSKLLAVSAVNALILFVDCATLDCIWANDFDYPAYIFAVIASSRSFP